jgi:CRP-like cAMP-binding protein
VLLVEPSASVSYEAARARAQVMEQLFLFRNLPFPALLRVSRICEDLFFQPGQVLVEQGAMGDSMYVIVKGEVRVSHNNVELARLGPGEHFGEMTLLDQHPRSATVKGLTGGSAVVVRRSHLYDFCKRDPELGIQLLWKLLTTLGQRLRETNVLTAQRIIEDS